MSDIPQSGKDLVVAKRPSPKGAQAQRKGGRPLQGTASPSGVKQLSERAQGLLHRLLDECVEPKSIAKVVWLQTRERVSAEAITRYASRYRKRQQEQQRIREKLDGIIAQARKEGITTSDLLRAALLEKLSQSQRDGTLKKMDLLALETVERKRGEYELKQRQAQLSAEFRERELQLKERQTRISEKRFRLERKKAQATFAALEGKAAAGRPLNNLDVSRLRELYGLYQDEESANDKAQTSDAN